MRMTIRPSLKLSSRRTKTRLRAAFAASFLALSLAVSGCDSADFEDITTAQQASPTAPVPTLPAQLQSDEDEDFVEAFVDTETGGKLVLPNGAELEIPAGALATSQTIRFAYRPDDVPRNGPPTLDDNGEDPQKDGDVFYEVTPSQVLAKPATLRIPYPLDPEWEFPTLYSYSEENPLADYGSEQTRFELEEPDYNTDTDQITYQTTHFSGFDLLTAGEPAYLVMDVPGPYLQPADILMTMTKQDTSFFKALSMGPGPGWTPGHVGIYTGPDAPFPSGTVIDNGGDNPSTVSGRPDAVEAVPKKVHATNVDFFRSGFHNDHLYLGPRRARGGTSQAQRNYIVGQAPRALNKDYYLLGDAGSFLGSFFNPKELVDRIVDPFATSRGYSCVGLVDVLYVLAGQSLVSNFDRGFVAVTPKDMMESTDPVRDAQLRVGQPFQMSFYGIIRKPEYGATTARVPYIRDRRASDGGVDCSYDIEFENQPPGASVSEDGQGYTFRWTPNQPGRFKMTVRMRADVKEKRAVTNIFRGKFKQERTRDNPINESFEFVVN
jgi:hypothetical protein